MATKPARALALLPTEPPPPRHARVRSIGQAMLFTCFLAGRLPGVVLGMVIGPPVMERCAGAPDPIGCLIVTLD